LHPAKADGNEPPAGTRLGGCRHARRAVEPSHFGACSPCFNLTAHDRLTAQVAAGPSRMIGAANHDAALGQDADHTSRRQVCRVSDLVDAGELCAKDDGTPHDACLVTDGARDNHNPLGIGPAKTGSLTTTRPEIAPLK